MIGLFIINIGGNQNENEKIAVIALSALLTLSFAGCGDKTTQTDQSTQSGKMTDEERIVSAAKAGMVGNWGLGNEYEIQALLAKYDQPTDYVSMDFTMDQFATDAITLASAMTYNELGLVKNDYDGGYGYGDTVGTIDMNDQGVAMLEDMIFFTKDFAAKNPNTVHAFVSTSLKGWKYACEHPDEAAEIVYKAGSSVSSAHQAYMAKEVVKLVQTDTKGNTVTDYGHMDDEALQQTLDLAKKYIKLDDSTASAKLSNLTLDDIRDASVPAILRESRDIIRLNRALRVL